MSELVRKTFTAEVKAIDDRTFEGMISTESVDRDGDILLAGGAQLDNFLKNPVVLFGHNYFEASAVVAKALELEPIPGKGIRARWEFAGPDISEGADMVRRLWAGGFLNAISVGFIPKEWQRRADDNDEELARGLIFTSWELLEFSIVPVPANQDALRLAMKALSQPQRTIEITDADGNDGVLEIDSPPDPEQPANDLSEAELDAVIEGLQPAISQLEEVFR